MESYPVPPDDLVADTIESLQQQIRLLEQWLDDAERAIEDRAQMIDRLMRELENHRRQALLFTDCERPGDVAQILRHRLPGWSKADWEALIDFIRRFLAETLR